MSFLSGLWTWLSSIIHAITRIFNSQQEKSPSNPTDSSLSHKKYQTPKGQKQNNQRNVKGYPFSPEIPNLSLNGQRTPNNQNRSSTTNIKMSELTLNDMLDDVNTVMECSTIDAFKFAPETLLRRLTTPEAVKKVIQEYSKETALTQNTTISDLVQFYSGKAFKVFAILTTNRGFDLIEHFYVKGFQDDMLPVRKKRSGQDSKTWEIESCNKGTSDGSRVPETFRWGHSSPWGRDSWRVDQFCQHWQWPFVPPVLIEGKFRYNFPDENRLPFTRSWGKKDSEPTTLYSYVEKMSVHAGHLPKNSGDLLDDKGNVVVAIKELKRSSKDFAAIAEGEAVVLEMMRGLTDQPHLIKAIAYYQKGNGHYFMFPWAELGNLWEFWITTTPKTERDYMIWVFTQLTGLARALECLHHRASTSEENYRHGDLKPLNILCFKTKSGQEDKPRLVITDVGLAKRHNMATKERQELAVFTYSTAATVTHAAPELGIVRNAPRSRRYDIWSMGCILLEFTIWLLYGPRKLIEFSNCLDGSFYTLETHKQSWNKKGQQNLSPTKSQTAKVHAEVGVWISYIKADWRCSKDTAVRRLVELIETRLLVVDLGLRNPVNGQSSLILPIKEEASDSQPPSPIFGETLELEPGSMTQPSITATSVGESDRMRQKEIRNRTPPERQNTGLLSLTNPDPKSRAYAPEMRKEIELILTGLDRKQIQPIGSPPLGGEAPPPGPSRVQLTEQNRHVGGVNTRQNLNDDWDYAPDDNIAGKAFAGLDLSTILPQTREPSQLCRRCSALRLWSTTCIFTDSLAQLEEKANKEGCTLCKLLLQSIQPRMKGCRDFVRFARVGSYLTMEECEGQAIANLYAMPGSRKSTLQDVQMGIPKLPRAGSATHLKIMKEWIRCCDDTHDCYPKDLGSLPTRFLDVSDSDSGTVRLVNLGRNYTGSGRYAALSHRWGSPQLHAKFCTYKSNIGDLQRGFEITRLPKTFQDAVHVTRGLGLKRLWIDSLCIVQDDQDDWEAESKLMGRVFSSAYCTIAASCASGSSDGFLKPRPERRCVVMQGPPGDGNYCVCETIDDFHRDVDQGELNLRGWVLQERALSRRTIYFTETQSYWECGGGVQCETMTKMKNRKASFLGDANFPNAAEKYVKGMRIELSQDLYERYSKLALSFPSDRPIAIKGLETRLLDTFGTTGGYGVFDIYLHRCLLWQCAGDTLKHIDAFRGGKIVPSWSWMAYDGPIRYMIVPFGQAEWCNDIISPFSRAAQTDVALDLEAPIWEVVNTEGAEVIFDDPRRALGQPLHCVVVGKSKAEPMQYYTIILHLCAHANEETYERVGVGILGRRHIALGGVQRMARIR